MQKSGKQRVSGLQILANYVKRVTRIPAQWVSPSVLAIDEYR